ncbi:hypothetical protein [Streptomyces iconiensis]|uniref:Transposase n=1 Tax=Streptomyces iconiensis TaxID=1384038 RepID=A0ABT7A1U8_9ACTN|nr:hypothetical protein [Streptomyces iconiensis]MDJ1134593.1 hypothetical protein [Streptomyces iconiensis]
MKNGSYFPGRGTLVEETFLKGEAKGIAKGIAQGITEERARFVLLVLDNREIPLTESQRVRITACTDPDQLDHWVKRAMTVTHADELLDGADKTEAGNSTSG